MGTAIVTHLPDDPHRRIHQQKDTDLMNFIGRYMEKANIPRDRASWSKYTVIGMMYMSQTFPSAFITTLLPTIFREQGLDLEKFWMFSLATVPYWIRWLWAPVVDNYGSARIGRRKSWFIPCTIGACIVYASVAFFEPSEETIWFIIILMIVKSFLTTTQEMAIDGYLIENLEPKERPIGSAIRVYFEGIGEMTALAGLAIVYDKLGWQITAVLASMLMLVFMMPGFIRKEPPLPDAVQRKRELGQRPSLLLWLKRKDTRIIVPLLFTGGLAVGMFLPMVGAFLIDIGYSVTQVGVITAISLGGSLFVGATLAIGLVQRFGTKTCLKFLMFGFPITVLPAIWLTAQSAPPIPIAVICIILPIGLIALLHVTFQIERLGFASKHQAATDYAINSSAARMGQTSAAAAGGFIAAQSWTLFFIVMAVLGTCIATAWLLIHSRLWRMIAEREAREDSLNVEAEAIPSGS
jgi:PAT family beta-lactamase induction signal transducer AmpG